MEHVTSSASRSSHRGPPLPVGLLVARLKRRPALAFKAPAAPPPTGFDVLHALVLLVGAEGLFLAAAVLVIFGGS